MRQNAASRAGRLTAIFRREMSTISRIPQIILRQQAIARSLPPFGLALACFAVALVVLAVRA